VNGHPFRMMHRSPPELQPGYPGQVGTGSVIGGTNQASAPLVDGARHHEILGLDRSSVPVESAHEDRTGFLCPSTATASWVQPVVDPDSWYGWPKRISEAGTSAGEGRVIWIAFAGSGHYHAIEVSGRHQNTTHTDFSEALPTHGSTRPQGRHPPCRRMLYRQLLRQ